MTIVDEHDEGGPMSVRGHHLVVATAKHVFLHREYGVVFVREAASREDLAAYDLTPLLLYGLSVPGTSLRWVMLTPVHNPASIVSVLGKAWTRADGLRGRPDVLKVSLRVQGTAPVTSTERWPALPDVPTVVEAGYPDLVIDFWYALFGPAKMPAPLLAQINKATREALDDPATIEKLSGLGSVASPSTPEQLNTLLLSDYDRYAKVVSDAGIAPQ